jgi:response regulator RpfG family c-di-GMP phosphodiesterase
MNFLEHISFKYKLFIPFLFTLGLFGIFLAQSYSLSTFIEKQLLSIHKQEIWLSETTQSISKNINNLKSRFVNNALQNKIDKTELEIAQKKFNIINNQITQIEESKFLHNKAIKQSLKNLRSRLHGYYSILLDLPDAYAESHEEAIYTTISLGAVYIKIENELNILLTNSKEQLNKKIISIQSLVTDNRNKMIYISIISLSLLAMIELLLIKEIFKTIQTIKRISKSFYNFLQGKVEKVEKITHFPKDEIGQILYIINENTKQAEVRIIKERKLTQEINILNNTLEERVQNSIVEITSLNKEIEDTQREVIFTMGAIGESRSKETGNHVRRVAEYSKLLAILYGIDEKEAELIKEASPMHDIGKVAIPDQILNKPAKLTKEEFSIMQTHAQIGYDMLKHSNRPILKTAAIIAYQHHEKYNGKGYPNGLKGDEIHIYGSITAIADVFDALGSDRVYKKAWELNKIINLFKEEKGEHFHPELTQIFLDNLDKFLEIKTRYEDCTEEEMASL